MALNIETEILPGERDDRGYCYLLRLHVTTAVGERAVIHGALRLEDREQATAMVEADPRASNRIREFRLARQMTQKQLATAIAATQPQINKWEGGHHAPSLRHAMRLAEVLGASLHDLGLYAEIDQAVSSPAATSPPAPPEPFEPV